MKCQVSSVVWTCGLGIVGDFGSDYWKKSVDEVKQSFAHYEGTGFFVAGFVNTSVCEKAYKELCDKNKIVYQSPVRKNKNSDNNFFFCIFDAK